MQTKECFICGKSTSYNNCPICYECSQAYKKAIAECISDLKKEQEKINNSNIALKLGNEKYADIVMDYLYNVRFINENGTGKYRMKIRNATRYLFDENRTSSIINELLFKGILMINENGDVLETPKEMVDQQRKANQDSINRQAVQQEFSSIEKKLELLQQREEQKRQGSGMLSNVAKEGNHRR